MEFVLFVILALGFFFGMPIVALIRASQAIRVNESEKSMREELLRRVRQLEIDVQRLHSRANGTQPAPTAAASEPPVAAIPIEPVTTTNTEPCVVCEPAPQASASETLNPLPPIYPAEPTVVPAPEMVREAATVEPARTDFPETSQPRFNWEQFMGVKLFAWVGGLALFIGIAFFVAYSFQQNLIKPPVRVALGFLTGLGVIIGGLKLCRERYAVTVQTLCASGILILYADIFASCSHYEFISKAAGFGLMSLVTATAFLLAVRLDSPAVAIIGLAGGFLTPPLLPTKVDNPLGLFMFVGLLDVGLAAVAIRKQWHYLVSMAAVGTVLMQFGWVSRFFEAQKFGIAACVFLTFSALFAVLVWLCRDKKSDIGYIEKAGILMPGAALVFGLYVLAEPYPDILQRPAAYLTFLVLADVALLGISWMRDGLRLLNVFSGAAVFMLFALWTGNVLTPALLNWALIFFVIFAVLHTAFPIVLERLHPSSTSTWWPHLFAPMALVLMMIPILRLDELAIVIWPVMLLVDMVAIGVAVLTFSMVGIFVVLAMTILAMALWIAKAPAVLTGLPEMLFIIGGFAVFFFFMGLYAVKKIHQMHGSPGAPEAGEAATARSRSAMEIEMMAQIPALSAILPFMLLTMVSLRLPLADPSPVFGLAALLTALLLGVIRFYKADALGPVGLVSLLVLEYSWHLKHFSPENGLVPLMWYIGFYSVFTAFPFLFERRLLNRVLPWAVAALAGPAQFYLVHRAVALIHPNSYMGLLPTAFAVPAFVALIHLVRSIPSDSEKRNTILAFFGGVALFFVTLIFPIQFDRQWITIGWALEGAALLWLMHRIPHPGLKYLGVGLLLVSFARLALNPAVLHYQARSETPILNWFLYAYGIVTVCLFAGAKLMAPPNHLLKQWNVPPVLAGLGAVLAFLLLNIEIADYYSTGRVITFEFSGNLARDMTYSLAWAVFSFVLLVWGIWKQSKAARYAGIALLCITVLKLFLHDLWSLGALYRVGSFIGLALVLIPVSFLYQRYLSSHGKTKNDANRMSV